MSEIVLKLEHITKEYQGVKALDDVSIQVKRGEIYGLVGNNGAGKTTLMRLVSGQTFPDAGIIRLFDSTVEPELRLSRQRTGVLIEEPGFYADMTAAQNLEYFRMQFGIPGKDAVEKALAQVGLEHTGKKKFKQFSMGMRQRLGIALALMKTPELLILDEPINGLDPAGIIEVRQMLLDINQKHNTTILISSHILAELENVVTCYGFLSRGKLLEEIGAKELAEKCGVFLNIAVDQPEKMCLLLEKELGFRNYKVYPDRHIHLYEGIDEANRICSVAVNGDVSIQGIAKQRMSLENYYMNLVEGC
ncbi:MAG: ABC transporter ATP-binding protein [Roseburia sp.]